MANGPFRCNRCKRVFSMAAHLARHNSAVHGVRKGRAGRPPKASKRFGAQVGRHRGRPRKITRPIRTFAQWRSGGTGGPQHVISAMEAYHRDLVSQRSAIDAQIDAFTQAMQTLGAAAPKRPGKRGPRPKARTRGTTRAPRAGTLRDYVLRVLGRTTRPMSPHDIGLSVRKAGFKTKAKDLTKAVSNLLPTVGNVKKVGFGQYRLVRGAA